MSVVSFDAEGPYPLIAITNTTCDFQDHDNFSQWFSTDLALSHNVILRALNSIWLNAPLVAPEDVQDFAGYGLACASMIRVTHQEVQERIIFPRLQETQNKNIDMRANVVQHLAFEKPLDAFERYLRDVHDAKQEYDSEKMLYLRAELGIKLVDHLHSEPVTLSPEKLYALSKEKLRDLAHSIEEHNKDRWKDTHTLIPFMITNHNKEDAPDWPIVPPSMRWVVNHVGFHLHRHYWKFSPYTEAGEFQTYYRDAETNHNSDDSESSTFKLKMPSSEHGLKIDASLSGSFNRLQHATASMIR